MSNKSDLKQLITRITGISNDQLQKLYMPVGIYLQEAEDLYHAASGDLEELTGRGLSLELFHSLPARIGATREAQSKWAEKQNKQKDAIAEWKGIASEAFDFRDDLLDEMEFAFRHQPELLQTVSQISEGESNADMIQDLNDIAVLGRNNLKPLEATGFDMTQLQKAAGLSDTLAGVLAEANGDRMEENEERILRDKAYTYLKIAVDEVRSYGKFVFRKDAQKLKVYRSRHIRSRNRRSSRAGSMN